MNKLIICICTTLLALTSHIHADICGKADIGAAYIHLDLLNSGKTFKRIDMGGVKADATVLVWKGVCLKPTLLYGNGHGEIFSGGLGLGHYTPIGEKCSVTPSVGCIYTQLDTSIRLAPSYHASYKFYSVTPYVGLDASWCFTKGWRIVAVYQYSWSGTLTKIKGFPSDRSHSEGSNYGLMIEGDINSSWSVSLGGAYNLGLTKEKHGLRAYGARIAVSYWF
jgi:hypothetical protein